MESMCGKFPLANRPKMTRRKRKNLNLAPGASSTTPDRPQRGGSSPTMEPVNTLAGAVAGTSSSTQNPVTSLSVPGPHRRAKGTKKARKRGGNPYSWMPLNDNPSSPTTDEAPPITPQSDMSSTFSVSPSPRSSQPPRSPVLERRNAVSAGPRSTQFGLLSDAGSGRPTSHSAPLIPTHTWPQTMPEEARQFRGPTLGGLAHTQSDGTLGVHSQAFDQRMSTDHNQPSFGASPCDLHRLSYSTNYTMLDTPNQPNQSFDQSSSVRADSLPPAGQTLYWQGFPLMYPSIATAEHSSIIDNSFNPGSSSTLTGPLNIAAIACNGLYSGVDENHVFDSFGLVPLVSADRNAENHSQGVPANTRQTPVRSPHGEGRSLASSAFNHF
ncbi:unnamed protein product [Rhizoctonia solani]|uniref:Uncharacterized protein n=1 Tax=Rhizoctonia solani TaxID=456999 RepID=A0A8H2WZX6_9AGAM|nr:unnamed protein product [Rhizoctonia solani]